MENPAFRLSVLAAVFVSALLRPARAAEAPSGATSQPAQAVITVRADQPGKPISPDLFGVFFEDLSYAADGGLYAELVQNRSFDYSPLDRPEWNATTGWEVVTRGGA